MSNKNIELTNQKQANKSTTVSNFDDNNRYGILAEDEDDTDDGIIPSTMGPTIEAITDHDTGMPPLGLNIETLHDASINTANTTAAINIPDDTSELSDDEATNTTTNLINEMEQVAESINHEYDEIMGDFGTSYDLPHQYWDQQKEKFDAYVALKNRQLDDKHKRTHELHKTNMKTVIDTELKRFKILFETTNTNSTATLKAERIL